MAGMATKIVKGYFEDQGLKVDERNELTLRLGWGLRSAGNGSIDIFFNFYEDDSRVHVEGINFCNVPEDKFDRMYKLMNDFNAHYSFVSFYLDEEHQQITAQVDAVIQLDTCGEECNELMERILAVVEDAYPEIMKTIWS